LRRWLSSAVAANERGGHPSRELPFWVNETCVIGTESDSARRINKRNPCMGDGRVYRVGGLGGCSGDVHGLGGYLDGYMAMTGENIDDGRLRVSLGITTESQSSPCELTRLFERQEGVCCAVECETRPHRPSSVISCGVKTNVNTGGGETLASHIWLLACEIRSKRITQLYFLS